MNAPQNKFGLDGPAEFNFLAFVPFELWSAAFYVAMACLLIWKLDVRLLSTRVAIAVFGAWATVMAFCAIGLVSTPGFVDGSEKLVAVCSTLLTVFLLACAGIFHRVGNCPISGFSPMSNHLAIAEQMIAHYNAQDADAYVALMTDDACEAGYRGAVLREGKEGTRSGLKAMFAEFPENRAEIITGYALGEFAVLHEKVYRSASAEPFEVMSIYTFAGDKCSRVEFVR